MTAVEWKTKNGKRTPNKNIDRYARMNITNDRLIQLFLITDNKSDDCRAMKISQYLKNFIQTK
ncbi:hypothetical protein T4B_1670 [Trichinella pseudospiralis]|uniref:Uncharacterized protein n=1 Tax=Trichinella pseudospiralis TaxID=6337 RepID=A0A0V1J9W9_TRIPS|nr:hypothetical protein T4B_1670 [Trichinella pseudospiralis]KRZ31799.1 hypothetical protein T4C_11539 [Trichinella pseudospiralis]